MGTCFREIFLVIMTSVTGNSLKLSYAIPKSSLMNKGDEIDGTETERDKKT